LIISCYIFGGFYMDARQSLSGKTIVVTGATSGIGLATATQLASRGAFIIGVGRSQSRCLQAEKTIRNACSEAKVEFLVADLSSLNQIRELAEGIRREAAGKRNGYIDVLINNAGTVSSWYVSTAEGFELQFAVNHLAPFLLTHELMPLLKAAPFGRVITVSSGSHYHTRIHWKDILLRRHYNCLLAYKQSKLANILFSCELNRRLGSGASVHAYAVDPGLVNTEIGLKGTAGITRWVWMKRSNRGVQPSDAAVSVAFLAADPSVQGRQDVYWKECRPLRPSHYSQREDIAGRLWELSEGMCGIESADYGLGLHT
jgi:NAD(P)-dependent dehydrogenase (short-subunit alcohol dehydrogenase family)